MHHDLNFCRLNSNIDVHFLPLHHVKYFSAYKCVEKNENAFSYSKNIKQMCRTQYPLYQ